MICPGMEPLLIDRAAGVLEAADAERVEAHVAGCERCRAEAELFAGALDAARLPADRGDHEDLTAAIRRALHHSHRRSFLLRATAGAFAAAAAIALVVLVPPLLHHPAPRPPQAETWQEPDLDTLWEASAIAAPDAVDSEVATETVAFGDSDM